MKEADVGAFFQPHDKEIEEALHLTQNVAGEVSSVIYTVPDVELLLSDSIQIFQNIDVYSWSMYIFSIIFASILILLSHKKKLEQLITLLYRTLLLLIQHTHLPSTSKHIKHIMFILLLISEFFIILIRNGTKSNLVTISDSQFVDTIEQIEARGTLEIVTFKTTSFYLYIKTTKKKLYPSISKRVSNSNFLIKSKENGKKILAHFLSDVKSMETAIFVLSDQHLIKLFEIFCQFANFKTYCSKYRFFSVPTYITYNLKLPKSRRPLIEYL